MSIIADPATFIARITVSGLRGPTDDPIRTAFAVNGCPLQCQSESDVRPEKLSCCFWQVAARRQPSVTDRPSLNLPLRRKHRLGGTDGSLHCVGCCSEWPLGRSSTGRSGSSAAIRTQHPIAATRHTSNRLPAWRSAGRQAHTRTSTRLSRTSGNGKLPTDSPVHVRPRWPDLASCLACSRGTTGFALTRENPPSRAGGHGYAGPRNNPRRRGLWGHWLRRPAASRASADDPDP